MAGGSCGRAPWSPVLGPRREAGTSIRWSDIRIISARRQVRPWPSEIPHSLPPTNRLAARSKKSAARVVGDLTVSYLNSSEGCLGPALVVQPIGPGPVLETSNLLFRRGGN